ncbi:MAG: hypothetical protein Q9227_008486 [Pyrenula ochraceoflavens]
MSHLKPPLEIAIVGGGLGGLFAALALHHHCKDHVSITVYEQAPEYKEIGAGVGIGVNAAKLIDKLGLLDDALAIAGSRQHIWLSFRRFDNGDEIHTVPAKEEGRLRQLSVQRAEWLDVLVNTVKKRGAAKLETNKGCMGLKEEGERMVIKFRDGTTTTVDLVVGADGIHSNVRADYIVSPGALASKVRNWWPLPSYGANWLSRGRHFLVFPIGKDENGDNKTLNIVAFVTTRKEDLAGGDKESWTLTADKEDVLREFEGFEPTVRRVIENMDAKPAKWLLHDRQPFQQWVFGGGKVVLLGDAAHAMLPHQGAGAGQAMEDGYILGRALQDYFADSSQHPLDHWLRIYQAVRLPRAQRTQDTSRELGQIYEMQTKELKDRPYEECLPLVKDKVKDRMNWIWNEDLDAAYEKAKANSANVNGKAIS